MKRPQIRSGRSVLPKPLLAACWSRQHNRIRLIANSYGSAEAVAQVPSPRHHWTTRFIEIAP